MPLPHVDERKAIELVLADYFDGLYYSDSARLRRVLHPAAHYVCVTDGSLLKLDMAEYWPVIDRRPSPASKGEARADRIVSIEFAGPVTAHARLECTVLPRRFIDLLTLIKLDSRWQVISKVFHYELASVGAEAVQRP